MKTLLNNTIISIVAMLALLACLNSCTHNNGDIGPWFGQWHVEAIEVDDTPFNNYRGEYFILFQSRIVSTIKLGTHSNAAQSYGTWQESGNQLTIYFPDSSVLWFDIPGMSRHNQLTIEHLKSPHMTLSLTSDQGQRYRYHLKKRG